MNAVILAAGVGNRLRPFTEQHPKCLLTFGGKTLLRRHLEMLEGTAVRKITVVVGHLRDQIAAEVERIHIRQPVELVYNSEYTLGSALSLLQAQGALGSVTALIMDADLLLGREMVNTLVSSAAPSCLLADGGLIDTGEEVKVVVRSEGTVCELGKLLYRGGTVVGESVGLYKFSPEAGQALLGALHDEVTRNPRIEYEAVMNGILETIELHYIPTGKLPWIEIDFPEDIERARREVWPLIKDELVTY